MSLSLCEANDTRGLKALPLNVPPGSRIYGDAGYTDYQAEDDIQETEQVALEIMRKKRCRDGGSILPRFIYSDPTLNVIPPIPAPARFPRYGNAHQDRILSDLINPMLLILNSF